MVLSLLGAYLLAVLLLLITPGPVVALITHTAVRKGYRQAFNTLAGTSLASLVLLSLAVLILCGVLNIHPLSLAVIGFTGALFIARMSAQMLTARDDHAHASAPQGGFIRGFFTALANPKDILFFVAFFPQFIPVTRHFSHSVALLSACWVTLDLLIMTLWIMLIRRYVSPRYAQAIRLATALLMLAVAIYGGYWNGKTIWIALAVA